MNTATPTTAANLLPGLLQSPHFAQLGGEAVVIKLVDAFYRHMGARLDTGVIRAMHAADLASTKAVLVRYLCEWLGGPKVYSAQHGHPRLRMRHAAFAIGEAERDAWLACINAALTDVGAEPALHTALMASFSKTADFLRNTGPNPAPPATIPTPTSTVTKESP